MLVITSPSQAAQTGANLKGICEDQRETYQGVCMGYIIGISDILTQFSLDRGYFLGWQACMPKIPAAKAHDVVTKFLEEHPDSLDRAAFSLIARALTEAYPCK